MRIVFPVTGSLYTYTPVPLRMAVITAPFFLSVVTMTPMASPDQPGSSDTLRYMISEEDSK